MLALKHTLALAVFILGSHGVDVENWTVFGCGKGPRIPGMHPGRIISACRNLPANACCNFRNTYHTPEGQPVGSATNSVNFLNLGECHIGTWHWPRAQSTRARLDPGCGRERGSAVGPETETCLNPTGTGVFGDGAMWQSVEILKENKMICPPPGIFQALPDPQFTVSGREKIVSNVGGNLPAGWLKMAGLEGLSGRSIAGRKVIDPENRNASCTSYSDEKDTRPKCENVQYADTYHYPDESNPHSVYVLKGSKENHLALDKYEADKNPKLAYRDLIESLGAKLHADWRQDPELKRSFGREDNVEPLDLTKGEASSSGSDEIEAKRLNLASSNTIGNLDEKDTNVLAPETVSIEHDEVEEEVPDSIASRERRYNDGLEQRDAPRLVFEPYVPGRTGVEAVEG